MMTSRLRHRPRVIAAVVVVAIGLAAAAFGVRSLGATLESTSEAAASAAPLETAQREPAPDVTFTTADGTATSLADYRGQPLVLNFWASWCPPCVAEMGDAIGPAHEAHGDDVAFLGMNLRDEPAAAQEILDATGVTYDLALDPDGQVFNAFGGVGMPTTVFIDSDGQIVEQHTGIITREQLDAQVTRLKGA